MNNNLSIIVAYDLNQGIGLNNKLPWHIKEDLQFFRQTTLNSNVIMGRKNYESIQEQTKQAGLRQRKQIVLSKTEHLNQSNTSTTFVQSVEQAINACDKNKHIYVIGGAEIYALFLPLVDEIIATEIQHKYHCDTYFPKFNNHFFLSSKITKQLPNGITLDFCRYLSHKNR